MLLHRAFRIMLAAWEEIGIFATRMRRRRLELFLSLLRKLDGHVEILDIGGTQQFWDLMLGDDPANIRVTLLNTQHQTVRPRVS